MSSYRKWRESGHLERAIEAAGGVEAFEDEVHHLREEAQGWQLAGNGCDLDSCDVGPERA
ncbi:hypothetical protein [Microtetraspora malaysiensis]|uniref:hypothetical protein n=1 Tax=Microtetraspora malaysiensis TaxID=161358 RepID=UPI000A46412D|nr:hypothetical protein [Microtetraspora malaysiensis]